MPAVNAAAAYFTSVASRLRWRNCAMSSACSARRRPHGHAGAWTRAATRRCASRTSANRHFRRDTTLGPIAGRTGGCRAACAAWGKHRQRMGDDTAPLGVFRGLRQLTRASAAAGTDRQSRTRGRGGGPGSDDRHTRQTALRGCAPKSIGKTDPSAATTGVMRYYFCSKCDFQGA